MLNSYGVEISLDGFGDYGTLLNGGRGSRNPLSFVNKCVII